MEYREWLISLKNLVLADSDRCEIDDQDMHLVAVKLDTEYYLIIAMYARLIIRRYEASALTLSPGIR